MSRIINICNYKGGTGKTSVSVELCSLLGMMGNKVLGIDFDQQGNFSKYSGVDYKKKNTIYEVINAEILLEDAIQHTKYYDIVIANENLANAGRDFNGIDDLWLLSDAIKDADYDYIIIDNAPTRGPLLTMAYIASDYCIIVTECDEGATDGVIKVSEDIDRLKQRSKYFSHCLILGYLLNKKENTNAHRDVYRNLINVGIKFGNTPFKTTPRKSISATKCKSNKMSMNEFEYDSKLSLDYRNLVDEILLRIARIEQLNSDCRTIDVVKEDIPADLVLNYDIKQVSDPEINDQYISLMSSVMEVGILTPLLVLGDAYGFYRIIHGHSRRDVCRDLNISVPCFVIYGLSPEEEILICSDINIINKIDKLESESQIQSLIIKKLKGRNING